LVDVQNKAQSFVIKQSTETTLVLEVVSQGITKMLLSEWHLIKH